MLSRYPHTDDDARSEGGPAKLTHPHLGRNQMSTGLTQQFLFSLRDLPVEPAHCVCQDKIIPLLNAQS